MALVPLLSYLQRNGYGGSRPNTSIYNWRLLHHLAPQIEEWPRADWLADEEAWVYPLHNGRPPPGTRKRCVRKYQPNTFCALVHGVFMGRRLLQNQAPPCSTGRRSGSSVSVAAVGAVGSSSSRRAWRVAFLASGKTLACMPVAGESVQRQICASLHTHSHSRLVLQQSERSNGRKAVVSIQPGCSTEQGRTKR